MSNAQDHLSIFGGARCASNHPSTSRAGGVGVMTSGITETSILNFEAGKMTTRSKPNGDLHLHQNRVLGTSTTDLHSTTIPAVGSVTSSLIPPSKIDTSSVADLFNKRI